MVDYTKCDTCVHKDVCKYRDTPKVTSAKFSYKFKDFKDDQTFDVIFKCKKYEKRRSIIR